MLRSIIIAKVFYICNKLMQIYSRR